MWKKQLAVNKKARFNYFLEEFYEAGMVLEGSEVKSCKAGKLSIKEAYCKIFDGEVFVCNMNIVPYEKMCNYFKTDPKRKRKLLLHKKQIKKLEKKTQERGYTLVPTKVYIKDGVIKIEIALGKGKQNIDKRKIIAKRTSERQISRALKNYRN